MGSVYLVFRHETKTDPQEIENVRMIEVTPECIHMIRADETCFSVPLEVVLWYNTHSRITQRRIGY